jgi:hypothetical protein
MTEFAAGLIIIFSLGFIIGLFTPYFLKTIKSSLKDDD